MADVIRLSEKQKGDLRGGDVMEKKMNILADPPEGCMLADPRTIPGVYRPARKVLFKDALAYAKKIKREENRDVTFEEMQQFAIRDNERR